jgi:putative ABC transport system ATP-binding protein
MLRCVNVHKSYDLGGTKVRALRGVNLSIDEAGFYAIMGASGSGKSTLLHLLAALDLPDEGELHIAGRRIDAMGERELTKFRRESVGIVFQQFNLIPTMTARQNAELPGVLASMPSRESSRRALELLDRLGMGERADHRPEAMSGGEQQRVAIARALFFSPTVLLADEPTGNLDSKNSESLWRLLSEIALERKMSVVMVTHEPAAAAYCRRISVLADGVVTGHLDLKGEDATGVAAWYQRAQRAS